MHSNNNTQRVTISVNNNAVLPELVDYNLETEKGIINLSNKDEIVS